VVGAIGLVAAARDAGGNRWLAVRRVLVGAAFLGAITDAMLLGHWYLVQPGLSRAPLLELVRWTALIWPVEVIAMLLPTGMVSVWRGTVDDGYDGILGWFWLACAAGTIVLCAMTRVPTRPARPSTASATPTPTTRSRARTTARRSRTSPTPRPPRTSPSPSTARAPRPAASSPDTAAA